MTEITGYFTDEAATFGDRVTAARETKGYSQQDLAHKLGVKLKTVRGWEDDVIEPRANKLQMIAGLTNVSIMWLLTGEGDGVDHLDEAGPNKDVALILNEITKTSLEIARLSDHMQTLERRLKIALNEQA